MKTVFYTAVFIFFFFRAAADIPTADFSASTVCLGQPTAFTNNSQSLNGLIIANFWDFGDGQGSPAVNPEHTYANAGTFPVTLTVLNSQGDWDDVTVLVTVNPKPVVNFQVNDAAQCLGSVFQFNNLTGIVSGSIVESSWSFADGAASGQTSPNHQYSAAGSFVVILEATSNLNCIAQQSLMVEVFPLPQVNFVVDNKCRGQASDFSNETQIASGTVQPLWTFGDGNSSQQLNPSHTYETEGTFAVTLVATSNHNCLASLQQNVIIHPRPVANFNISDHCFGTEAVVENLTTISSGNLEYHWDFGNQTSSTDQSPEIVFDRSGNFLVSLTATSAHNCQSSFEKNVYVNPTPTAEFSASNVCEIVPVKFINESIIDQGPLNFLWTFDDGATSDLRSPEHAYTNGIYDVSLLVTSPLGNCTDFFSKTITALPSPSASFEVASNCLDSLIRFSNTTEYEGDDVTFIWNFGDGNQSTERDPSIHYLTPQTYLVSLSASAGSGCRSEFSKSISIYPKPVANFFASDVCDKAAVSFQNLSAISVGEISFDWNFADNNSSTQKEPQHQFANDGQYTVVLKVTSDKGCRDVYEKIVSINPLPVTNFVAPPVCLGAETRFNNTSDIASGSISQSLWDFGDGTNSIVKNPSKEFLNSSLYTIELTSTSDKNCTTSKTAQVQVYQLPLSDFAVSDVCFNEDVVFNNASTIPEGALNFTWDFGDSETSSATSPIHRYNSFGVYEVSLMATSQFGCKDSVSRPLLIFAPPEVDAGDDVTISQGYSTQLQALGASDYHWEPIDGLNNSSISNPIATPLRTIDYVVTALDSKGCANADTVRVSVMEEFKLVASNILTPDNNGSNDSWTIENVETFGDVFVQVYDRWGTLVYEREAYKNDWRGERGNDLLPDGTYYYYITFDSSPKVYKGALTLIRNDKK